MAQLIECTGFYNLSSFDDANLVTKCFCLSKNVAGQQYCFACLFGFSDALLENRLHQRVKVCCWLIKDKKINVGYKGLNNSILTVRWFFCITSCRHPHSRWFIVSHGSFLSRETHLMLNRLKPIVISKNRMQGHPVFNFYEKTYLWFYTKRWGKNKNNEA
jgi:hypothetical protein